MHPPVFTGFFRRLVPIGVLPADGAARICYNAPTWVKVYHIAAARRKRKCRSTSENARRTARADGAGRTRRGRLNAGAIITGDDHRFGFRGETGVNELRTLCEDAGVLLSVVPRVKLADGTVISSSAIRQALRRGDLSRAEEMLGRPVQEMLQSQER